MWEDEEGWALKNRCLWTVVLERLLRVPWAARRLNQSVLKEINPEYHWKDWYWTEAPILLQTDVKNWLIGKDPQCWERLKVREEGDNRGWDGWMESLIEWTWVWADSGRQWRTGNPGVLQSRGHKESDKTEELNNNKEGFSAWGSFAIL